MDVGLVCEACRTFNPMGERACARCGERLSLDAVLAAAARAAGGDVLSDEDGGTRTGPPALGSAPNRAGNAVPQLTTPGASRVCLACAAPLNPAFKFCGACGVPVEEHTRPAVMSPLPPGPAQPNAPTPSSAMSATVRAAISQPLGREGSGKKTLFFGAMQASRAKLTLIKGDGLDGISFTLAGEEHLAGRGEDVPLTFAEDPYMSPVHANFFYRKGKLVVRDESSANGVYIRIRGAVPIEASARFLIGEQVIEVQQTPGIDELRAGVDGTYFYASPLKSIFRVIQLLRGGDTGLSYQSATEHVSLGREGNDINFPDDPFISGHHAQVSYVDGKLSLTDLGSKNGTFLRLSQESVLEHGDYVFMGQQLLRVEIV
ncbi:MAG TPA: FHA domain-containing protein [Kofleriaceae bacterium]|nr:FHA domain-containing protein [Kofleriaceae bacterium]